MRQSWLLAFILMLGSPAWAGDREHAREAYRAGLQSYNLGEYAKALDQFKEAYRAFEDSVLLFNIAQCHRQLGETEMALRLYRSYLRENPSAPNRDEVLRLIDSLERRLAPPPAPPSPPAAIVILPAPTPERVAPRRSAAVPAGAALLSIGGVALIAGAIVVAVGEASDAQAEHAGTLALHDSLHDRANAMREGGWPTFAVGALAIAAGATALALRRGSTRLSFQPSTSGGSFTIEGRF